MNLKATPVGQEDGVLSLQPCPTLCDRVDRSPPGSSVHGLLQARTLEWVAISFSKFLDSGIEPESLTSPALAGEFFTTNTIWEASSTTGPLGNSCRDF